MPTTHSLPKPPIVFPSKVLVCILKLDPTVSDLVQSVHISDKIEV